VSRQRRVPLLLVALLAGSVSAAAGIWKRVREWRESAARPQEIAEGAPTAPPRPHAPPGNARVSNGGAAAPSSALAPAGGTYRGDAQRRHRSAYAGPGEPRVRFALAVGGPIAAMPALTPEGDVIVATLAGKVSRISAAGEAVWTADLGDRVYSSPLILNDLVLIGSDADRFVALALADGKQRWLLRVDADCDTSPAAGAGGVVLVAAGTLLYAVQPGGRIAWRVRVPGKIYASPAVAADGTIYAGAQDDHLYAISKQGEVVWRRDLGADVDCAPAIGDAGEIYAGSDAGQVVSFDAGGALRWRADVGGFVRGGLTVARDGTVLAGTYGPAPRVVALDGVTGAERWSFRVQGTGAREFGIHGGPLEDSGGNFYFGAQDDRIYALDPAGRLRWTHATGGDVDAPLLIGPGGVLYAGSEDGNLYALH
jgi:outer membrane protein assembly factor BamB